MKFTTNEKFEYSYLWAFFLCLAFLKEIRRGISDSISFFLMIIDLKIVLQKFLGLKDFKKAQTFYIHKWVEVIIIYKDDKFKFIDLQIVVPSLRSVNNNWKVLIMSFILGLCRDHFS